MTNDEAGIIVTNDVLGHIPLDALPFNPATDLIPVLFTTTQSIGTQMWIHVHLEAGTYLGACFFPAAGDGLPHSFHGMHTVFEVT